MLQHSPGFDVGVCGFKVLGIGVLGFCGFGVLGFRVYREIPKPYPVITGLCRVLGFRAEGLGCGE